MILFYFYKEKPIKTCVTIKLKYCLFGKLEAGSKNSRYKVRGNWYMRQAFGIVKAIMISYFSYAH